MRISFLATIVCVVTSSEPGTSHRLVDPPVPTAHGRPARSGEQLAFLHSVVVENPKWNSVQVYEAVKPLWKAAGLAPMTYPSMRNHVTFLRRELGLCQKRDAIPSDQVAYLKVELMTNPDMTPTKLSTNLQTLFGSEAAPHHKVVGWLKCARRTVRNARNAEGEKVKVPIRYGTGNQMDEQQHAFLKGVFARRAEEEGSREAYAALVGEFGPNAAAIQPVNAAWSDLLVGEASVRHASPDMSRASSSQRQRSRSHSPLRESRAGTPTAKFPGLALASMHQHGRSLWTKRHLEIAMDVYGKTAGKPISIAQMHRWCSSRFAAEGLSPITHFTFKGIWKDIRPTSAE